MSPIFFIFIFLIAHPATPWQICIILVFVCMLLNSLAAPILSIMISISNFHNCFEKGIILNGLFRVALIPWYCMLLSISEKVWVSIKTYAIWYFSLHWFTISVITFSAHQTFFLGSHHNNIPIVFMDRGVSKILYEFFDDFYNLFSWYISTFAFLFGIVKHTDWYPFLSSISIK